MSNVVTYKDKLDGKAWRAVQAMIDGLRASTWRPWFIVNMHTFGTNLGPLCFGCAATCTVQKINKKSFLPCENIINCADRAKLLNMCSERDELEFEYAINSLRCGNAYLLYRYLGIKEVDYNKSLPRLTTANWRFKLHHYKKFANHLKSLDI